MEYCNFRLFWILCINGCDVNCVNECDVIPVVTRGRACVSSGDPTIYPNFNCIQYKKVLIQKMLLTNKLYLKLNLHCIPHA